jgi:cell division protein FtsB
LHYRSPLASGAHAADCDDNATKTELARLHDENAKLRDENAKLKECCVLLNITEPTIANLKPMFVC